MIAETARAAVLRRLRKATSGFIAISGGQFSGETAAIAAKPGLSVMHIPEQGRPVIPA